MIKEIQEITKKMMFLNTLVHGAILSEEDLYVLENAIMAMSKIQNEVNCLLHNASLIPITNTNELTIILTKIHQLFSQLAVAIDIVYTLSIKFVRNYEEEWDAVRKNTA